MRHFPSDHPKIYLAMSFRTFKRSCTDWRTFARARKITEETGLTYEQAAQRCKDFNNNRTPAQIRKGTKLEFESQ